MRLLILKRFLPLHVRVEQVGYVEVGPQSVRQIASTEFRDLVVGKMKTYASFDDYLKDQVPQNQAVIGALRRFVKRVQPKLKESVKWGNGCWIGSNGPVAYVYSATGSVQFGFFYGSSLKDPRGLLEGEGKYVRHTKVRDASEIDERAFAALLKQASGS